MSDILLSIIVPVYNVEYYIERCLSSIINSDISSINYELIIVNDGTKDNSMLIVDRFASENNHIKIINQENQGLSGARNTGVQQSKGRYIWFIDSDDYIETNVLMILTKALEFVPDVIRFDSTWVYKNKKEKRQLCNWGTSTIGGLEYLKKYGTSAVWTFMYNRDFLLDNNLYFIKNRLHEDDPFNFAVCLKAKSIIYIPVNAYYYDKSRDGSITNIMNPARISSFIENVKDISVLIKNSNIAKDREFAYSRNLDYLRELFSYQKFMDIDLQKKLYDKLASARFIIFPIYLKSRRLLNILEGLVFVLSPRLAITLRNYYKRKI